MKTGNSPLQRQTGLAAGIVMRMVSILLTLAFQAVILFLGAMRFDWIWAWVFLGINFAIILFNALTLLRTNPEVMAERGRPKEFKDWDKAVGRLWALAYFLLIPLIAGLDFRFGWTRGLGQAVNIWEPSSSRPEWRFSVGR